MLDCHWFDETLPDAATYKNAMQAMGKLLSVYSDHEEECYLDKTQRFESMRQRVGALIYIYQALQEKAANEKLYKVKSGCEWCNKKNITFIGHDFHMDGNALYYEDKILGMEGIKINYCPNCGRKLGS